MRSRAIFVVCAAGVAGCGLLFDFGDYDVSRTGPTEGGAPLEGDVVPPDAFTLSVDPASTSGTTGERKPVLLRIKRGERFTGEVTFPKPAGDVLLEAPAIPAGASNSAATVILGPTHGAREVTITGQSANGATASTVLRIDVRGQPGTLDTTFGSGGIVEIAEIAAGVDVVITDDERIVVATRETTSGPTRDALSLARLTPTGALDPTFGAGGRSLVLAASGGEGQGTQCVARGGSVASFLVGGTNGPKGKLVLAAVDGAGKPVTAFGASGSGPLVLGQAACRSLSVLPDGAMLIAASTFLQRRKNNGDTDDTWADGGEVDFSGSNETLVGALAEDGGAVRAYGTEPKTWSIGPDGSRGNAALIRPPDAGVCSVLARPAPAPGGRALVGPSCSGEGGGPNLPVIGVLAGETPSGDFAGSGFVSGPSVGYASAVVATPEGYVRVSGTPDPDHLSVRMWTKAGVERWAFDGSSVTPLADMRAYAAAVDSRGRIVVVGARNLPSAGTHLVVIRLWG